MDQAFDAMQNGAQARRSVRDALNAIDVPAGIKDQHRRLVAMVEDAAAAMDAAYAGLGDARGCAPFCYYADAPGWQTFLDESNRISGEFAAAESAWQNRIDELRAALGDVSAPEKPVV